MAKVTKLKQHKRLKEKEAERAWKKLSTDEKQAMMLNNLADVLSNSTDADWEQTERYVAPGAHTFKDLCAWFLCGQVVIRVLVTRWQRLITELDQYELVYNGVERPFGQSYSAKVSFYRVDGKLRYGWKVYDPAAVSHNVIHMHEITTDADVQAPVVVDCSRLRALAVDALLSLKKDIPEMEAALDQTYRYTWVDSRGRDRKVSTPNLMEVAEPLFVAQARERARHGMTFTPEQIEHARKGLKKLRALKALLAEASEVKKPKLRSVKLGG